LVPLLSSKTVRDDGPEDHNMSQMLEAGNTAKVSDNVDVNVRMKAHLRQTQKHTNNLGEWRVELDYQKVLRNTITELREPIVALNTTTSTIQKAQEPSGVNLRCWRRALPLVGIRKFTCSNKEAIPVFNLNNDGIARVLEMLMAEFGRGTHSSFLDDTYNIYLREDKRTAICFKVIKKVAVMYGDPLCAADEVEHTFKAFCNFCKQQRWDVAVVGAGPTLAAYAKNQCWRTMMFAVEQILNPMTNGILDETSGKTIRRMNRKLVTNSIKLYRYEPRRGIQVQLEQELMEVYNAWRKDRRKRHAPQAYSAVINPFAVPNVTRYMYTTGNDGKANSLAGLIRLGANDGYLLEPCIQLPNAPKGVTGFLVTHAMGLLRDEGVNYMSFGLEALPEIGEITLMPSLIKDISRRIYRTTFDALGLCGRKAFHESFHPDKNQQVPLYLLFPPGPPRISVYQAVLDATHISPHEVWNRAQAARTARRKRDRAAKSKPPAPTNRSKPQEENRFYE
jgi:Phosphatidylglycerol lysyltransferase, C-terminal